jgi:GAF domain-containing protein
MSPPPHGTPASPRHQDRLGAALQPTVVMAATEIDRARLVAHHKAGQWSDADPPTTEPEILAAVRSTQQEIAAGRLATAAALDLLCRLAQFLTDAAGAVVEFVEGAELVYRAASGTAAKSLGLRVDTERSLSGLCFRTGEVMRCDDTEEDGRVDKAACRWVGIRSMVLVPVAREGRRVGVLAVISPAPAAFGDRDVWALDRLAEVVAENLHSPPAAGAVG